MSMLRKYGSKPFFPASLQRKVVRAMLAAHPYEEVAYDIYPLENKGNVLGLGKIGYLPEAMTLEQFAGYVKERLDVPAVRVVGALQDTVKKKVAVVGGDGNKYIKQAKFKGADVYVTGDLYYHVAHDAMMLGLHVVDPGHNVEKNYEGRGAEAAAAKKAIEKKLGVTVHASTINTEPFTFI
ncbi:hypothetical protein GCM10020331_039130 [Ectobacillus funiculus]